MHLGLDGTAIPVRKPEVAGRSGKQPDGSAKTLGPGSVTYSAAIGSALSLDTEPQPCPFAGTSCSGTEIPTSGAL